MKDKTLTPEQWIALHCSPTRADVPRCATCRHAEITGCTHRCTLNGGIRVKATP